MPMPYYARCAMLNAIEQELTRPDDLKLFRQNRERILSLNTTLDAENPNHLAGMICGVLDTRHIVPSGVNISQTLLDAIERRLRRIRAAVIKAAQEMDYVESRDEGVLVEAEAA